MKRLVETFQNIWKIEDLRVRIINTLGLLLIYRLGSFVVLPGVDPGVLNELNSGAQGLAALLNIFAGGAFSRASSICPRYNALHFCIHCNAVDGNCGSCNSKNATRG